MEKKIVSDYRLFFIIGINIIEPIGMLIKFFRRINTVFLPLLCFFIISVIVSVVIWTITENTKKNYEKLILPIMLGMIIMDQGLKCLVDRVVTEQIVLIPRALRIYKIHNLNEMAALNFLHISIDHRAVIGIKVLLCVLILIFYLVQKRKVNNIYLTMGFTLLISACVATILDSVFWPGTLDFISFTDLVCVDVKDFYVVPGASMFVYGMIKDQEVHYGF